MMAGMPLKQFHVFLASPGDTATERDHVRSYFEQFNRSTALLFNARFEVVDSDGYASGGVGRAQALITSQTLERFRDSLALVIGIMSQRFGSPTGEAGSGTEEEFRWALKNNQETGFPEIKWFFRKFDSLRVPPDPDEARRALDQWEQVHRFREALKSSTIIGRSLPLGRVATAVEVKTPFQTVHADFPHTAYGWPLGTRHYAVS